MKEEILTAKTNKNSISMILGLRKRDNGYSNDWMSYYPGWHKPDFRISPASYFDNRLSITITPIYGMLYLHIPFIRSKYDECDPPTYGVYFYGEGSKLFDCIVLCYGKKRKFIYMPWDYAWVRTSNLKKDGTWEHEFQGDRKDFYKDCWKDVVKYETFPYTYVLKNGTIQDRTATIKTTEMEWRPRWFKWTSLFSKVKKSIDIEFNDEVGERTGSWKGGTMGCSYNLLPNETPEQCLRRMEKERKF